MVRCDYFSAYRKYMADADATVRFCLAHLIREVRFLAEHTDPVLARWGKKLLDHLRQRFRTLHRRQKLTEARFARAMETIRRAFLRAVRRPPDRRESRTLAKRFRKHGGRYFTVLTAPGVAPTNNLTEQSIRHVATDRRIITQGTPGVVGQRGCERIWSLLAACVQQGRSPFAFLLDSVNAHFHQLSPPSLLPVEP